MHSEGYSSPACLCVCPFSVFCLHMLLGVREVSVATVRKKTKKPFALKLLSSKVGRVEGTPASYHNAMSYCIAVLM